MRAFLVVAMAAAAMPAAARAQTAAPQDQVYDLATIQAAHDVCGFPLTDEQLDVIDQRREALGAREGIPAEQFTAVAGQVAASLQRQVGEGLCKPNGPEAQLYRRKLVEYGLL